jgi:hypothetical protein
MLRAPRKTSAAATQGTMPFLRSDVQTGGVRSLQSGGKPHRNRALIGSAGVAQG